MYFLARILGTFFVLLLTAAILWRKKSLRFKLFSLAGGRSQINVITLNQTVWIRVIICVDLLVVSFLKSIIDKDRLFLFEMFKLIIIDNICYRFLFPVYLIINTKSCLPELFSQKPIRKLDSYKSKHNLIPRGNALNVSIIGKTPAITKMEDFKGQRTSKVINVKEAGQRSFIYLEK